MNRLDLKGQRFGKLLVIDIADKKYWNNKNKTHWLCLCDCGNTTIKISSNLKNSKNQSCQKCTKKKRAERILNIAKSRKKNNTFEEMEDCIIGNLSNGSSFTFDKKYFDIIKNYYWRVNSEGYVITQTTQHDTNSKRKIIKLHKLITGDIPQDKVVDHIDRNKLNNRCSNLRIVTKSQNGQNVGCRKTNKLGIKNIHYQTKSKKYRVSFDINKTKYYVGEFNSLEQAIIERNKAYTKYKKGE